MPNRKRNIKGLAFSKLTLKMFSHYCFLNMSFERRSAERLRPGLDLTEKMGGGRGAPGGPATRQRMAGNKKRKI